jgi:hypothetical protein
MALVQALLLQFQPALMGILPLYVVLLAVLPLVLAGFRSWSGAMLAASFALWLWVQFDDRVALAAYPGPDRVWFFNPFAWQALFLLAAWFGWRNTHGAPSWIGRPWLFWLAAALSLAGFVIRFNWTLHDFYDPIPNLVSAQLLWPLLGKTELGILRLVNVLAVALLVAKLIPSRSRFLTSAAAWPFVICGRNSLHILVLNEFFGGVAMQFAISVAGVVIMIGFAALLEWFVAAQGTSGGGAIGAPTARKGARG